MNPTIPRTTYMASCKKCSFASEDITANGRISTDFATLHGHHGIVINVTTEPGLRQRVRNLRTETSRGMLSGNS